MGRGLPHHLAGKEWDPEARLYYFGFRWYEPQQGAFISRSPLGPLAEETYAYCSNDPVNFIDPNGLFKEKVEDLLQFLNFFGDEVSKNWLQNLAAMSEGVIDSVSLGCLAVYLTDQERVDLQNSRNIGFYTAEIIEFLRTGGGKQLFEHGPKGVIYFAKRGMNNPKTREAVLYGQQIHEMFRVIWRLLEWDDKPYYVDENNKIYKPDALTEFGEPVELKPDSPSGRRKERRIWKAMKRHMERRVFCFSILPFQSVEKNEAIG